MRFHGSLDNIYSVGTNNLIKNGAKLVTGPVDILKNYPNLLAKKIKFLKEKNVNEEYVIKKNPANPEYDTQQSYLS